MKRDLLTYMCIGVTTLLLYVAGSAFFAPLPTLIAPRIVVQTPEDMIFAESLRAGINPHLPLNIGWRESRYGWRNGKFEPWMIGPSDDWGIFQLHRASWVKLTGHLPPLDAKLNIVAGVWLVRMWLTTCKSERAAMHAYATGHC